MTKPVNSVRKQFALQASEALSRIESNSVEGKKNTELREEIRRLEEEKEQQIQDLQHKIEQANIRADWEEDRANKLERLVLRFIKDQRQNFKVSKEVYNRSVDTYHQMLNVKTPLWCPDVAKPNSLMAFIYASATYYNIPLEIFFSKQRISSISRARHMVAYLANREGYSFPEIARWLRLQDHSSVMYGERKLKKMVEENDAEILKEINEVKELASENINKPIGAGEI